MGKILEFRKKIPSLDPDKNHRPWQHLSGDEKGCRGLGVGIMIAALALMVIVVLSVETNGGGASKFFWTSAALFFAGMWSTGLLFWSLKPTRALITAGVFVLALFLHQIFF